MKKLVFACLLGFGSFSANAQDEPGTLSVSTQGYYSPGQDIAVHADYIQDENGSPELSQNTWKLIPCDPDGNPTGEEIMSITNTGSPAGDFVFAGSADLAAEQDYMIVLTAVDALERTIGAPPVVIHISVYTLTGADFFPCGQSIVATAAVSSPPAQLGYKWQAYTCDMVGGNVGGSPFYTDNHPNAVPSGAYTFSNPFVCEQYYKIVLTFYNSSTLAVLATRSKVVCVSSFLPVGSGSFCKGSGYVGNGYYYQGAGPAAAYAKYDLRQCTASGVPVPGGLLIVSPNYLSGTTTSGVFTPANYYFTNAYSLPAGYYLLELKIFNSSLGVIGTGKKLVYCSPLPAPSVSGSTSVCGTGTYTETNTSGVNVYSWWQQIGSLPNSLPGSSNSVTIPYGSPYNHVGVTVTNASGCSGGASLAVSNSYFDPTFYVNCYPNGAGKFKIMISRTSSCNGLDVFTVEKWNTATHTAYANSGWTNSSWSSQAVYSTPFYFYDFNGNNGYYANLNDFPLPPSGSNPYGTFMNGSAYRITRTINSPGCVSSLVYIVDQNGICSSCRYSQQQESAMATGSSGHSFDVFPNPNNGTFTIQLASTGENVNAELYSAMGQRIDAFAFSGTSFSYSPAETLAPGIYLLRVNANGTVSTKRIVIQ